MMNLVRWNPWKEMSVLQNRLNHLFNEPFMRSGQEDDELSLGAWYPAVDMFDNDDKIVIKNLLRSRD